MSRQVFYYLSALNKAKLGQKKAPAGSQCLKPPKMEEESKIN